MVRDRSMAAAGAPPPAPPMVPRWPAVLTVSPRRRPSSEPAPATESADHSRTRRPRLVTRPSCRQTWQPGRAGQPSGGGGGSGRRAGRTGHGVRRGGAVAEPGSRVGSQLDSRALWRSAGLSPPHTDGSGGTNWQLASASDAAVNIRTRGVRVADCAGCVRGA